MSATDILTSQNYQLLPASTMKLLALSTTFLLTASTTLALPGKSWHKPAYFVLAGDSTTAVQASGGGGWGDGFLNHTLRSPATGENLGHNGATTVSFREGGDWAHALQLVQEHEEWWDVFVTIQVREGSCFFLPSIGRPQSSLEIGSDFSIFFSPLLSFTQ